MQEWIDYAVTLKKQGRTWREIRQEVALGFGEDKSENAIRKKITRVLKEQGYTSPLLENDKEYFSEEYSNGSLTRSNVFPFEKIKDATPEMLMKLHGLDAGMWEVVSYRNNVWNAPTDGGKQDMYQSKVTVKPKKDCVSLEHIDEFFKHIEKYKALAPSCLRYDACHTDDVLEVCLPDLHVGLLAWAQETGEDYDLKIVRERFSRGINDIVDRAVHKKFSKVLLISLGDLLHVDNDKNETYKGTLQQADGRFNKIFDFALDMLLDAVSMLLVIAPVEYVYIPGNHDRQSGYAVATAVKMAFRENEDVTFDTKADPQKFRQIGVNLIAWVHGDMPIKNAVNWVYDRARVEYGMSKHCEVHAGHFHSEKVKEFPQVDEYHGIKIRYLPTICSASYYEHHEGYPIGEKTIVSFVWNKDKGLREQWFSNV